MKTVKLLQLFVTTLNILHVLSELLQALQVGRKPVKFLTCSNLLKYVINFHVCLSIYDEV